MLFSDELSLICVVVIVFALNNVLFSVPSLRDIYYRESGDGLYSATVFLIAYALHVLPFTMASSAIFSSVVYWYVCMLI